MGGSRPSKVLKVKQERSRPWSRGNVKPVPGAARAGVRHPRRVDRSIRSHEAFSLDTSAGSVGGEIQRGCTDNELVITT
jgi:hypothetical protein